MAQVPLGALGRQDLLHVVDNIAVQLGGSGREGLLGKGPGRLAARHHRMVQRERILLLSLQETQACGRHSPALGLCSPCPGAGPGSPVRCPGAGTRASQTRAPSLWHGVGAKDPGRVTSVPPQTQDSMGQLHSAKQA